MSSHLPTFERSTALAVADALGVIWEPVGSEAYDKRAEQTGCSEPRDSVSVTVRASVARGRYEAFGDYAAMKAIFPILAILGGVYSVLGIWFPRLRGHWKGTRMTCGLVSCAGIAAFFISLGADFLVEDAVPERYRIWLFLPVILSWIVVAIGYALDSRNYARSSPASLTVPQRKSDVVAGQRGWFFVAFGFFFLIMVLWTFVFHK